MSTVFPVIGIGASAGGLDAFKRFFEAVPPETGMAFILIQHLDPTHDSSLPALLQNYTSLAVEQVQDRTIVKPEHVYVIPPGKRLTIKDGTLHLDDPARPRGQRAFIDEFFRSLASDQGERSACIILSGTGSDGSMGLKSIKESGGAVLVQEPTDAEYDGMPNSALATGLVDLTAPADELARKLIEYHRTADRIQLPDERDELPAAESATLQKILAQVRIHTKYDFSRYKDGTILRRLKRRMQVHQTEDMASYLALLRRSEDEVRALMKDFLISVTNFFRDPDAFEALRLKGIPKLFENKQSDDPIRVWVPGCATGEEAFSIAMLLCEEADAHAASPNFQIFASDIDEEALEFARRGLYPDAIATDLSPDRLRRFFSKEQGGYQVRRFLQDMVLFAHHNVLSDPPFSKLDLISCRNLLIYLQRDVQQDVFHIFHYALRRGGFLFLGSSETAESASDLFGTVAKKYRLYRRKSVSTRVVLPPLAADPIDGAEATQVSDREQQHSPIREVHRELMLDAYAPPSVLVDEHHEICHVFGDAGRYLRPGEGEPSHDLLQMVPRTLRVELRTALFQVFKKEQSVNPRRVRLERDGQEHLIDLVVRPVQSENLADPLALVIFEPVDQIESTPDPASDDPQNRYDEAVVEQLEEELRRTKRRLNSIIEEYETSNEELKASNEELQSMNEELHSTTEELETSKEELQSTNEELKTVNTELNTKVDELNQANSDLENLMASTRVASLFLDNDLLLQRYTQAATRLFNIIPADVGRPFSQITHKVDHDDLSGLAKHVLNRLEPTEEEIRSPEEGDFLMRMMPYRNVEDKIDGVVVTFFDITDQKDAQRDERKRAQYQAAVAEVRQQALEGKPVKDLMDLAVVRTARLLNVKYCKVLALQPEGNHLLLQAAVGWPEGLVGEATVSSGHHSQAGYTLKTREPVIVENMVEEKRFTGPALLSDYDVVSGVSVVVQGSTDPYGVMGAHTIEQRTFTNQEVHFLQSMANVIGMATERQRIENALRESEEQYRRIVTTANEGIWVVNEDGQTQYANEKMAAMLGCTVDDLQERSLSDFVFEEDVDVMMEERERREQGLRAAYDARYRRTDGSVLWAHVTTSPIHDEDGAFAGAFAMFTDITDRKDVEETLRQLNETLEERVAERTKQVRELASSLTLAEQRERHRIAQILHDDLQQLLHAAQVQSRSTEQMLSETQGDVTEQLAKLNEVIDRAIQVTRTLTVDLSPPVLDEEGLANALSWLVTQMQETHGLAVHVEGDQSLSLQNDEMRVLLFQLVRELLLNVVNHAGVEEASVRLVKQDAELRIYVEDDGVGFDVDAIRAKEDDGEGFGLYSIHERLGLFGGDLTIESNPDRGTEAVITVPIG